MDLPGMVGALPCDVDLDAAPVLSTPPVAGIYRCSRSYPQNPHHDRIRRGALSHCSRSGACVTLRCGGGSITGG